MARDLDDRIFRFVCRIVDLFEMLHARGGAAGVIGYQLLGSGTSIGANYEEAAAGQSKADFIAKLATSRKECRETLFWLRLIAAEALARPRTDCRRHLRSAPVDGDPAHNHPTGAIESITRTVASSLARRRAISHLRILRFCIPAFLHSCIFFTQQSPQ
ncbi:MAG TPA: four helix bundle protein [Vicinamibacterales bacterium]